MEFSNFEDKSVNGGFSTKTKGMIDKIEFHEKEIKKAYIKRVSKLEKDKAELREICESLETKLDISKNIMKLQLNSSLRITTGTAKSQSQIYK